MSDAPGFDDLDDDTPAGVDPATGEVTAEDEPARENEYAHVGEFVHRYFLEVYPWKHGKRSWCEQWYRHPEALAVFTALWLTWEARKGDGEQMAVWIRDFKTPMFDTLTGPQSPFIGCTPAKGGDAAHHVDQETPAVLEPPAGYFG